MPLPPELLAALSGDARGAIALVVGAGCSLNAPTSLELSSTYSARAYEQLVEAGVITRRDCDAPTDLSCLADAVQLRRGSQRELVERLPVTLFRNARANDGYLTAAALMREQKIAVVLTLNFDLAMQNAVTAVSPGAEITVIRDPSGHGALGSATVIHLHRDAYAEFDEWVLRTDQLEEAWRDGWEEVITTYAAARPIVIFAGLGSRAAVLTETVRRIRLAVAESVVIEVSPGVQGSSEFSAELNVAPERYLRSGWVDFMDQAGRALAAEQVRRLVLAAVALRAEHGWPAQDSAIVASQLKSLTLLQIGHMRACWLLTGRSYDPEDPVSAAHLADLIDALAVIAAEGFALVVQSDNASVEFWRGAAHVFTVFPASGRGILRWQAVEERVRSSDHVSKRIHREPLVACCAGVPGPRTAAPENLVSEPVADVITGALQISFVSVDELRSRPREALQAAGL